MGRRETWKNTSYPNAKPSWQKNPGIDRKTSEYLDRRDKYFSRLNIRLHPKEYIRNYKLYKKYALLTNTKLDENATNIFNNLERSMRLYGK